MISKYIISFITPIIRLEKIIFSKALIFCISEYLSIFKVTGKILYLSKKKKKKCTGRYYKIL